MCIRDRVCGGREAESGTVSVRSRFEGDRGPMGLEEFIATARELVESKAVRP